MYIISKLFTFLILPPGIFIILLFLASVYAKKFKKTLFLSAILFYALSNSYVADFLLLPLEKPFYKIKNIKQKADAVVILGGGHLKSVPNTPLREDAFKRAIWGISLANKYKLPILFSGGGLDKSYSEADAFYDVLKETEEGFGVKTTLLNKEAKSLDTYQNAKYSKEIFNKLGIKKPKIFLVTSAYHMSRSIKLYKHFGFDVIPMATDFKVSYEKKNIWDLFPQMGAFKRSYKALHEYFGILSLYLRGIY
ncbi:YdcF family protein [Sulfurospirillum sp. 1307]|jgi:uncharacterized SAM-binding protein YcdF (DUF218 family)